jgi:anti-anti-sigma factor
LIYISSAGLRVVFKAAKALKLAGGKLAVANRQPQIVKVFDIVKALPDLTVFSSDAEMDDYLRAMQESVQRGGT